jgi:hypothetical protein
MLAFLPMRFGRMEAVSPMTSDKKHAPDSLKYQWRLLGLVQRSDWATSGCDRSRLEREMANEDDTPLTTALELGMLHEVDGVASIADIKPSPAQAANWAAARKAWEVLRTYEQQNY